LAAAAGCADCAAHATAVAALKAQLHDKDATIDLLERFIRAAGMQVPHM
jgi:hypothetical protein